jgi:hypothetical protein
MQSTFSLNIEEHKPNNTPIHFASASNEGGVQLYNGDPDAQKGKVEMVKKMTKKVLGGASLMELTLPANMLYKASNGELISSDLAVLTAFATEASKVTDPVERIKILTAGFVGGLTTMCRELNGAPPIPMRLGETY